WRTPQRAQAKVTDSSLRGSLRGPPPVESFWTMPPPAWLHARCPHARQLRSAAGCDAVGCTIDNVTIEDAMSYRSLLVHLDDSDQSDQRLGVAARLARKFD